MSIRRVIEVMNEMQADGVIDRYAIGGAVGATFYLEPVATLDVDIFIAMQPQAGQTVIDPQPVFHYLKSHGYSMQGEYVVIAGWPVQLLPPPGRLAEEALEQAVQADVDGIPAPVMPVDYLAAICLETGRAKDKARLLQFIEAGALDAARFEEIVARHGLTRAWDKFQSQFLEEMS